MLLAHLVLLVHMVQLLVSKSLLVQGQLLVLLESTLLQAQPHLILLKQLFAQAVLQERFQYLEA